MKITQQEIYYIAVYAGMYGSFELSGVIDSCLSPTQLARRKALVAFLAELDEFLEEPDRDTTLLESLAIADVFIVDGKFTRENNFIAIGKNIVQDMADHPEDYDSTDIEEHDLVMVNIMKYCDKCD